MSKTSKKGGRRRIRIREHQRGFDPAKQPPRDEAGRYSRSLGTLGAVVVGSGATKPRRKASTAKTSSASASPSKARSARSTKAARAPSKRTSARSTKTARAPSKRTPARSRSKPTSTAKAAAKPKTTRKRTATQKADKTQAQTSRSVRIETEPLAQLLKLFPD